MTRYRDRKDTGAYDRRVQRRLDAQDRSSPLRSASVSGGETEFIGENSIQIIGSGTVYGTFTINGPNGRLVINGILDGDGNFHWTGPWELSGPGKITGDVEQIGDIEQTGNTRLLGKITAEGGDSPATLEDGKLSFETGGKVEADVANNGARLRANDAVVNVGNVASMRKGSTSVIVGPLGVTVNAPSGQEIRLQGDVVATLAMMLAGLTAAPPGMTTAPLVADVLTGRVYRG